MKKCKNCGEIIGYNTLEYFFTERKIYVHLIEPFFKFGNSVTDKCNKPEPTEVDTLG